MTVHRVFTQFVSRNLVEYVGREDREIRIEHFARIRMIEMKNYRTVVDNFNRLFDIHHTACGLLQPSHRIHTDARDDGVGVELVRRTYIPRSKRGAVGPSCIQTKRSEER